MKQGSEVMVMSENRLKKEAMTYITIMMVLGLVTIALGFFAGGYRGFYLALTLGGIIAVSSAIYLPLVGRRKAEDLKEVATPAIQSLWISTSMGLGYVVTAYAPYFQLPPSVATALFAVGWIMLGLGLYSLLKLSRKSGVPLAV